MSNKDLLNFLIKNYDNEAWDFYNFILIVKHFNWSFRGAHTEVGTLVYEKMHSDLIRLYIDLRIFQVCIETEINEELDLLSNLESMNFIFKINLDRILNKDVVTILNLNIDGILPRTKDEKLKRKIISINLIYGVFYRLKDVFFFNKRKHVMDKMLNQGISVDQSKWAKKILFTKGYVVVFPEYYVKILVGLVYKRKIVSYTCEKIIFKGNIKTVRESLKNENYSKPIWMKSLNINDLQGLKESEIVNNILDDKFTPESLTNNLNFLNNIELSPNMEFFEIIEKISLKSDMLDKEYITRERLEEVVIGGEGVVYLEVNKDVKNYQERINCLNFINLVKKQYHRFSKFFIEYRRDNRIRIYSFNYPLNFQLSHLVRNTINIKAIGLSDLEIVQNFISLPIWDKLGKNIDKISLFFWQKIEEKLVTNIAKIFGVNFILEGKFEEKIVKNLKIEVILILMESFAPKKIIPLNDRIMWVNNNVLENLLTINLGDIKLIEEILKKLGIFKKKMHVIKNIYTMQEIYINKKYKELFWVDASSNAIQLITLRLGKFNDLLLQLTNIIDNKTECRNIYTYITNEMKKTDHNLFIKEFLQDKINIEEFNLLYNDDDNKDRIMPGSYGKGIKRARKDMEGYINEETSTIWAKLEREEKINISDYLWKLVFKILSNIGFDLELYKKSCKNIFGGKKLVCWYNDCDLPIVPFKEKKTKRALLLKKMEMMKFNKVKQEDIDELNKKISWDERNFYKRSKIRINNPTIKAGIGANWYFKNIDGLTPNDIHEYDIKLMKKFYLLNDSSITPRIKYSIPEIDDLKTLTALAPNGTHSYDGSNMDKTLLLMRRIGLNGLPIFDSIGGEILHVSLIKILFKMANIENIENNYKKPKFPYIDIQMDEEKRIELYLRILESPYFIR